MYVDVTTGRKIRFSGPSPRLGPSLRLFVKLSLCGLARAGVNHSSMNVGELAARPGGRGEQEPRGRRPGRDGNSPEVLCSGSVVVELILWKGF